MSYKGKNAEGEVTWLATDSQQPGKRVILVTAADKVIRVPQPVETALVATAEVPVAEQAEAQARAEAHARADARAQERAEVQADAEAPAQTDSQAQDEAQTPTGTEARAEEAPQAEEDTLTSSSGDGANSQHGHERGRRDRRQHSPGKPSTWWRKLPPTMSTTPRRYAFLWPHW
ncbi:MAG: hypothetical protein U1U88_001324 [Lawsonella clevelandensis]